jgi:hypothetical protein
MRWASFRRWTFTSTIRVSGSTTSIPSRMPHFGVFTLRARSLQAFQHALRRHATRELLSSSKPHRHRQGGQPSRGTEEEWTSGGGVECVLYEREREREREVLAWVCSCFFCEQIDKLFSLAGARNGRRGRILLSDSCGWLLQRVVRPGHRGLALAGEVHCVQYHACTGKVLSVRLRKLRGR